MNTNERLAVGLGLALLFTCAALAQTAAPAADPGAPPPPRVRSIDGIEYLNGGAGDEARAAIDAERGAFPLRLVFSVASGAYVVADHVDVSRGNAKVVGVDKAGPILMLKLAPGEYAVETSYLGRTARRQVRVVAEGTQIDWRLPDQPK